MPSETPNRPLTPRTGRAGGPPGGHLPDQNELGAGLVDDIVRGLGYPLERAVAGFVKHGLHSRFTRLRAHRPTNRLGE